MTQINRRSLNIAILVTLVSIVTVITVAIIVTNVVWNDWGFYEIFTAIGATLMIVGGIGVYSTYAGGYAISSSRLHAQAPEVAMAEMNYARKKRSAFPIISYIILGLGIVFIAIGLSGIF